MSPGSARPWPRGRRGDLYELMANTAAYSGLRQGELFALTTGQIDPAARVIDVDRKVIEVSRHAAHRAAQGPQAPQDHLPRPHPAGLPAGGQDRRPGSRPPAPRRQAGTNPLGLIFPSPRGTVLAVLQLRPPRPGRRLPGGRMARPRRQRHRGPGTACGTCSAPPPCSPGSSTPPTSSCMAGHANVRTTLDMYVGTTAGVLDRARTATA